MARTTWRGQQVSAEVRAAGLKSLRDSAEMILQEANETVPHDEGTLMRSGQVNVDEGAASITYDTPYAVEQHEKPFSHPKGRRSKWLLKTMQEQMPKVRNYMAEAIRGALRR